ncbi:tetratricopeptide repeat protein, partial [Roseomonas sp. GC11]|uniref:tetratricopeptide repeat protein n=1 Tax=Roseomonas sp. GC11 TaxID=2950546 RepID=UPI002109F43C
PRLPAAVLAVRGAQLDPAALAEARRLATQGQAAEAVARYRALFGGPVPPAAFASEYYETLAATPEGQPEARDAVERMAAEARPGDLRPALLLARILTLRPASRDEGLRRLQALARQPEGGPAAAAWRQALLDGAPAIADLEAYLAAFPQDEALRQRLGEARQAGAGALRMRGFAALNGGRLADAARDFEAVLAASPGDAEALGGLGLARLRQGRAAEARRALAEAVARDPEQGRAQGHSRWGRALEGATATPEPEQARALIQRGLPEQAEALLRRALRRDGPERAQAEALLAGLLLRRGDAAGAEPHFRAALARRPEAPELLAGLAEALQRQGRLAEAVQAA